MKKIAFSLLFIALVMLQINIVSTQDVNPGLINALKTPAGLLFIYNKEKNNFKFEIECQNAIPFDAESMAFLIDNRFFQLVIVPISEVIKNKNSNMSVLDILTAHKNFEMDYVYEVSGIPFNPKLDTITNKKGREFLFWEFNIPLTPADTSSDLIKTKMYMNTLVGDEVLSLSMVVTLNDKSEVVRKFLYSLTNRFESSENQYNIEQISDSLKTQK